MLKRRAGRRDAPLFVSVGLGIAVIGAVIFLLAPLLVTIVASVGNSTVLELPPEEFSTRWYERFLGDPRWVRAIGVSFRVAVLSTVITTVLGILASSGLVRGRFRAVFVFHALIILPMIVPVIVVATAQYFLFSDLGLLNTIIGLSIAHAVVGLPIMVIIVSASLRGFDFRLEDAAVSLGASRVRAYVRVTLPAIAPGVIAGALFTFLSSFDELMIPLFISGPETETLSVRIWNSVLLAVEPTIAAVSTVLMGVTLLVLVLAGLARRGTKRATATAGAGQ